MIHAHTIPRDKWEAFRENAHKSVFKENCPSGQKLVDFAVLAVETETDTPLTYVTCKELDDETVYWSYGGAFPETIGTTKTWSAYKVMTKKMADMGYRKILKRVKNTNHTMMKFALRMGYTVIGIRHIEDSTMVELMMEVGDVEPSS
jgi:hypothetical protein